LRALQPAELRYQRFSPANFHAVGYVNDFHRARLYLRERRSVFHFQNRFMPAIWRLNQCIRFAVRNITYITMTSENANMAE
jgi:hypothetical protein